MLAPGISEHHATGGFKYQLTKNSSIDFAAIYAFKNSVSGPEAAPYVAFTGSVGPFSIPVTAPPYYNPATKVTAYLSGLELSVSYSYKFDPGDHSLIPTHF